MTQLLVRYVGLKPSRNDNVAGTGVTWHGQGDVQAVPAAAWEKLKRHPDVWELVPSGGEAPPPAVAGTLGAAKAAEEPTDEQPAGEQSAAVGGVIPNWMTTEDPAELHQIAKDMGVKVHHKVSDPAKIREAIAAAAEKAEA